MDLPVDATHKDNTFRRYYHRLIPDFQKSKNRATTATIFSFFAISLFAWFAVKPTAQTIIYLQREISEKTVLNKRMEDKITALIQAQSNYEAVQNRLYLLEQALPHNPDGAILARELNNLVSITHASLSAIQVGEIPLETQNASPGAKLAPQKPIETFSISTIIDGSYQTIRSFITGLLQLRRLTTIQSITLRPNGIVNGTQTNIKTTIQLQSYYSNQ
jgi:Tfp pilus assembly protein PilO